METLRRVQRLTCQLLLVWFALSIGVAVAAPVLQPHSVDVVCSGSGALMLAAPDQGSPASDHDHDCRLCVVVGTPPVLPVLAAHEAPVDTPVLQLPAPLPGQEPVPFQQRGPPLL